MNETKEKEKGQILEPLTIEILIPQCCREGWETCKHIPKKQRKIKQNVGL